MNILGIESSCDETSVALYSNGDVKANLISSQDFHNKYGGVVPELSSRAHLQQIVPLVKDALEQGGITLQDIDAVAATVGPGLIGALLVGFTFAKGLAYSLDVPLIPVNHIEAHIYSGFLMEEKPEYPILVLVVSGGHSFLFLVKSPTEMQEIGRTIDDAAGEAFDKVSKMIGLGYPGGPKIQKTAESGDPEKIPFPVASLKNPYDFSFSGLKTAVLRHLQKHHPDGNIAENDMADIAASFQHAVIAALTKNTIKACEAFEPKSISLVGGVAANKPLRESIQAVGAARNIPVIVPAFQYCGDNAAMIALRGAQLHEAGERFSADTTPFPAFKSDYLQ